MIGTQTREGEPLMAYYEEDDLGHFSDMGKHRPDLFEKFMAWYQACQEDGALSRREKALIGLAVAHACNVLTALTLTLSRVSNPARTWNR
jgi:alkylhydroperoxidase/carboxymuconolactone decarboxylase family protein YurZ